MLRRVGRLLFATVAVFVGVYFLVALGLTFWPTPIFAAPATGGSTPAAVPALVSSQDVDEQRFTARDGAELFARHYPSGSDLSVLLLHGVTGDSSLLHRSATMLREQGAEVYALDLRGHGASEGRRGDIEYIGQYEQDVADVKSDEDKVGTA